MHIKIVNEREPEESLIYTLVEFYRLNDYRQYRSVDTTASKKHPQGHASGNPDRR